ncbi:hypothetical protein E2C01_092849 [Portunus trituberculatus]|uniref:Uncharacterized protein n=1 Tax=Portunus trituberculatus TaxID=210409 RepID=A0A5B7JLC2_PORTR|nr:hypothetical protein [Portunus trituberculatus]
MRAGHGSPRFVCGELAGCVGHICLYQQVLLCGVGGTSGHGGERVAAQELMRRDEVGIKAFQIEQCISGGHGVKVWCEYP